VVKEREEFGEGGHEHGDGVEGNVEVIAEAGDEVVAFDSHDCDEIHRRLLRLRLVLVNLLLDDLGGIFRWEMHICPAAMFSPAVYGSS
jgi:hypothetical protein